MKIGLIIMEMASSLIEIMLIKSDNINWPFKNPIHLYDMFIIQYMA